MARSARLAQSNQDRFLLLRAGIYYYFRRIPARVREQDSRGAFVRQSLKTGDLAKARAMRDLLEVADNDLWGAFLADSPRDAAMSRYQAAQKRAAALGFTYRPAHEIVERAPPDEAFQRIETAIAASKRHQRDALLGMLPEPAITVSEVWEFYLEEIAPHQVAQKSAAQKRKWKNTKKAAIDSFISVVGDINFSDIDRTHARRFFQHFQSLIAPKTGHATHTPSLGNRRVGDMRGLYRDYFDHMGQHDKDNPFDRLSFKTSSNQKRKRPSIQVQWIIEKVLRPGALSALNDEARGILLVVADIGARPSEICNLTANAIVLKHKIPHLRIEPRDDPSDPREIKTSSSIRVVPLVGLALAVFKKHPNGFPRYKDKEASLSGALNKYMRENKLFPSDAHSVYSLRHTFEDRMKEAGVDEELRKILMGHSNDRPEYGEGGSLKLRHAQMIKVALPYDPSIV